MARGLADHELTIAFTDILRGVANNDKVKIETLRRPVQRLARRATDEDLSDFMYGKMKEMADVLSIRRMDFDDDGVPEDTDEVEEPAVSPPDDNGLAAALSGVTPDGGSDPS